jgi:hypothetical protein
MSFPLGGIVVGVLACFLSSSLARTELGQEQPQDSRGQFLSASELQLRESLGLTPPRMSDKTDRMIVTEAQRLDAITGFTTPVLFTEKGATESHPEAGIILSRPQLSQLMDSTTTPQELLRFVLAHEKAHQLQFRQYGKAKILLEDMEMRRVYECQADILAAKYMIEAIPAPNLQQQEAILEAIRVSFELGSEEFGLATHPSRECRRLATRLGMAAGMHTNLLRAGLIANAQFLAQRIEVRPADNPMSWSLRQAKNVVRYQLAASREVVQDVESTVIKFNENGNPPIVTFELPYFNLAPKAVRVTLSIHSWAVPREDAKNTKPWELIDAKHFEFVLQPNKTFIARGVLQWKATPALMPRLGFPPDVVAMASCEYLPGPGGAAAPAAAAPEQMLRLGENGDNSGNAWIGLGRLYRHAIKGSIASLKGGIGSRFSNIDYFPCSIGVPDAVDVITAIPRDGSDPYIDVILHRGDDAGKASDVYQDVKDKAPKGWKSTREAKREGRKPETLSTSYYLSESGPRIHLYLELKDSGKSEVRASIYPPDKN